MEVPVQKILKKKLYFLKKSGVMIRILILTLIILNNCGKKGELYLDGRESNTIIEIEEERIYKF